MKTPSLALAQIDAPSPSTHLVAWQVLALTALAVICYHNSLTAPFIFDDIPWIVENESLRSLWPIGPLLGSNRPVLTVSLALNYAIGGTNVTGYHLTNLVIHLAAGLVLYDLIRRTLVLTTSNSRRSAAWLAAVISALWIAHPLQTQAVSYVVQRSASLMGLFFLLTLYCTLRAKLRAQGGTSWSVAAIACCWLGAGTKEVIATAPIIVLLFDRIFLSRTWSEVLRERWVFHLALFSSWSWLAANMAPAFAGSTSTAGYSSQTLTAGEYLVSQTTVLLHYLRLVVWPEPLCFDYYWPVTRSIGAALLPGVVTLSLFLASLWALRYRPRVGLVAFSFFLILGPTSSVLPIRDLAVEHRMYLPLACVVTLIVLGFHGVAYDTAIRSNFLSKVPGRALRGAAIVALVGCVALTICRNEDYRTRTALWQSVLEVNPANPRAYNQLGVVLQSEGNDREALECYREAVRYSDQSDMPPLAEYHYNLAASLHNLGHVDEAILHYRRSLQRQPRSTKVLLNLGAAYDELGRTPKAIEQYEKALNLRPQYSPIHNNLALALAKYGRYEDAVSHFRLAIVGDPPIPAAALHLGRTLMEMGQVETGVEAYRAAAALQARFKQWDAAAAILEEAIEKSVSAQHHDLVGGLHELLNAYKKSSGVRRRTPPSASADSLGS